MQLLAAAALFCCAAFSQTSKPDFSGTWKLNNGKSTHDGPEDRVYIETIVQSKNSITVTTKSEGVTNLFDGTFPISNKPHIEKVENLYRSTRVYWENLTLVFERIDKDSKKDTAKTLFGARESFILSFDGTVITESRMTITPPKIATDKPTRSDRKYVFDKQ